MSKEKIYKTKKLLPVPEVSKPMSHHKGKKRYIIMHRYTKECQDKKIKEYLESVEKFRKNEWSEYYGKKYVRLSDAEKAFRQFTNRQDKFRWYEQYEFKIEEIEEEEK
jgi:hypothetical protein